MNQCDGCRRGLEILWSQGIPFHDLSETSGSYKGELMACTAHLYNVPNETTKRAMKKSRKIKAKHSSSQDLFKELDK